MIPSWYALILLTLAAYRTWRLLAEDTILDRPRSRLIRREGVSEFVSCPWCLGFWLAVVWWAAWWAWPHGVLVAAAPFAVSALVGLFALVVDAASD